MFSELDEATPLMTIKNYGGIIPPPKNGAGILRKPSISQFHFQQDLRKEIEVGKDIVVVEVEEKKVDDKHGADSVWDAMRRSQIEEGVSEYDLSPFINERRRL